MIAIGMSIFMGSGSSKAFAHATPVEYVPASASIIATMPERISIRFSERVEPSASSITVFAPDGTVINDDAVVDFRDAYAFSVRIHSLLNGTYTVSWQVVSADDGHSSKGGFIFSVGTKTSEGSIGNEALQTQHRSGWSEATVIFLELLGDAIFLASLLLIIFLWRRLSKEEINPKAQAIFVSRMRWLILTAGLLIVAGGFGYLVLKTFNLAADQSVSFTHALRSFLGTVAGHYAALRIILGIILTSGLLLSLKKIIHSDRITKREIVFLILILTIDLLRARVSHAAASSFHPTFSILMNAIHLVSKDLWIGGLIVFVIAILPVLNSDRRAAIITPAFLRFGNLLLIALSVGGITGTYIVWLHLKSFANLQATHWGGYFVALAAYGLLLLALRLHQQWKVHPALMRIAENKAVSEDTRTVESAGIFLWIEMVTGLAVLLFSSILIITTPPLTAQNFYETTIKTDQGSVTFGEHHFESDQFLIVVNPKNGVGSGNTLTVTLTNQDKDIGPIIVNIEERFLGGYAFPKANLSQSGQWMIDVTHQQPGTFDLVAQFTVNYPENIDAVHHHFDFHSAYCNPSLPHEQEIINPHLRLRDFGGQAQPKPHPQPHSRSPSLARPRNKFHDHHLPRRLTRQSQQSRNRQFPEAVRTRGRAVA